MKVNDLYKKNSRHLVLNARDLPRHLAFDLAFEPEVVWATLLQLALLRHSLAFTSIRRAGQRASAVELQTRGWQSVERSVVLSLWPDAALE